MTATRTAALAASALLLAGCGGGGGTGDDDPVVAQPTSAGTSGAPSGATGTVLRGTLGAPGNPNAFEIGLVDSSGAPVSSVAAGTYTLEVDDRTKIHNFHLTGDGVDVGTGVSEVGAKSFTITLKPGEYRYVCDPHPNMQGTLTVTG